MEGKCILVCAGDFTPMVIDRDEGDLLIGVDGGINYLEQMGILPDLLVGDFDSIQSKAVLEEFRKEKPECIKQLPCAKDDTDTISAIRSGLDRGYRRFYLYGCLGGSRLDHTIANMQALIFLKEHDAKGYIMDASCMMTVIRNETLDFARGAEGSVSVFAMDRNVPHVTISGMKYNVEDVTLTNSWPVGVSNELDPGCKAAVTAGDGYLLVVIRF